MVRFFFLPLWQPSPQKTRRQGSRSPCRCRTCGVVFGSAPRVRCPKPWLLHWAANIPLRSTLAISLRPLSDTLRTWGVPCTFQSPPGNIWSTSFLKNMAKNVVLWISSRLCNAATWSPWIFNSVLASMQQRGKKFVVPIGSTWRRPISHSASQREIVEGFLVFYVYLFVSVGCCPSSDLYRFVKLSYESKLTCMCLRWIVYLHLSLSQDVFDRLFLTKHSRCFDTDTKGAEGAADLFEALSQSTQLENLDLRFCNQIPAAAWQKVRSAKWLHLKTANFHQYLAERSGWGFFLFSTCIYLSLLDVVWVQICIDLWSCLMSPSWPVCV